MAASVALSEPPARQARSWHWLRVLIAAIAAAATAWFAGFAWFLYSAARDAPAPPHVDAIVVLTGGPDGVEVALRLMAGGAADQLLVSGTGERTDLAVLAHLAGIDPGPLEHRITLGHAAHSTRGNALETASWARERRVGTLLVVTSWFHMPRALVEMRRAMPRVVAYAYPVGHLDTAELTRGDTARRMIGEYHKFLAARAGLTAWPVVQAAWGTGPVR